MPGICMGRSDAPHTSLSTLVIFFLSFFVNQEKMFTFAIE